MLRWGLNFSIVARHTGFGGLPYVKPKERDRYKSYGESLMGFSLIFLGLEFMSKAIPAPTGESLMFLKDFANMGWVAILVAVVTGSVFTMFIHASSATLAITIGLAAKGVINFQIAAAFTLGANIGTTFHSYLVSIGGNSNAKRAAWAHIIFNVFGTLWAVVLFNPFLNLVQLVTPGELSPDNRRSYCNAPHSL